MKGGVGSAGVGPVGWLYTPRGLAGYKPWSSLEKPMYCEAISRVLLGALPVLRPKPGMRHSLFCLAEKGLRTRGALRLPLAYSRAGLQVLGYFSLRRSPPTETGKIPCALCAVGCGTPTTAVQLQPIGPRRSRSEDTLACTRRCYRVRPSGLV